MKKIIKQFIPKKLLSLYRNFKNPPAKYSKEESVFKGKTVKDTFTEIYKTNHWGSNDSISGSGSDTRQTEKIVKELGPLFKKSGIKSILDIPCGDFNWMQRVDLTGIEYLGADIVEELILKNNTHYSKNNHVSFKMIDLLRDTLPEKDVVLIRDCFVHLSHADIFTAISNLKSSRCTYLLTTTFPKHPLNEDIVTGDWRTLDLTKPPFNFPKPVLLVNENCTEFNEAYIDKSLGLWKIADIKLPA